MSEHPKVKVQIEWGDIKHTVEGDLESVIKEVMQFAAKVLPNLSETVKLTPEGEVMLLKQEMSAENSIAMVLLAARVANAVGTKPTVDMSPEMISRAIGKAVKTVRNTLAMLSKTGIVERTNEGNYKLTMQGIRKSHQISRGLNVRNATVTERQVTVT